MFDLKTIATNFIDLYRKLCMGLTCLSAYCQGSYPWKVMIISKLKRQLWARKEAQWWSTCSATATGCLYQYLNRWMDR